MFDHKTLSIIRTVVGIIGNVISIFLFASPLPTFIRIQKNKSVEEFKADPYLATIMNCSLWIFYGLPIVHPNSTLVITTNSIGLAIELTGRIYYLKVKVMMYMLVEVAFLSTVASCTLTLFKTTEKRSKVVGIICVVFCLLMYISPLTVMGRVIKTRSVKYMPFYLSLANLANGIIWTIYAFIPIDYFIIIPNGIGTLSGIVQLALLDLKSSTGISFLKALAASDSIAALFREDCMSNGCITLSCLLTQYFIRRPKNSLNEACQNGLLCKEAAAVITEAPSPGELPIGLNGGCSDEHTTAARQALSERRSISLT
ncbi:hypothetical protein V2J09_001277 [Rumex salicifolius]